MDSAPVQPAATPDEREQILLRAWLDSADRAPLTPTYERLVAAARRAQLAGCTVLRGIAGFGPGGSTTRGPWTLVEHVPVIVELVDRAEPIAAFVETTAGPLLGQGLLTLERAHVMLVRGPATARQPLVLGPPSAPLATDPIWKAGSAMQTSETGVLLRIFIGESDRHDDRPLYQAIVEQARQLGLRGATVLRGVEGFGTHHVVHKAGLLEMSTGLPIVVEVVDSEERIKTLLPKLEAMIAEGTITMEYVQLIHLGQAAAGEPAPG